MFHFDELFVHVPTLPLSMSQYYDKFKISSYYLKLVTKNELYDFERTCIEKTKFLKIEGDIVRKINFTLNFFEKDPKLFQFFFGLSI